MWESFAVAAADLARERHVSATDDVHFCLSLAEHIVGRFSSPDDLVVDPFAGYGTALVAAERLGRRALGIELLPDRGAVIRDRVPGATVLVGDARELVGTLPVDIGLCVTSPPSMTATDHPQNPLTAYRTMDGDYERYLQDLAAIFWGLGERLRPGGLIVINVADQLGPAGRTPLVADVTRALQGPLELLSTIEVDWDQPPPGLDGDTCLVFGRASSRT